MAGTVMGSTTVKTKQKNVKTVFLDRDGVINFWKSTLVKSWAEFKFIPGSIEAIKDFVENDFKVIVITNQDVVGWGLISESALIKIHDKMIKEIEEGGGKITDIFYCPHNPVRKCKCRKPLPGMLFEAAEKHGIDPGSSWMVGDRVKDVVAGKAFGARTIQIKRTKKKSSKKKNGKPKKNDPDFTVYDLKEASKIILKESR